MRKCGTWTETFADSSLGTSPRSVRSFLICLKIITFLVYWSQVDWQPLLSTNFILLKKLCPSKVKQSCPFARHEGVWWNEGIGPLILNLCTKRRWVVSFTTDRIIPGGKPPVTLNRKMGWTLEPLWHFGEEKKHLPLSESVELVLNRPITFSNYVLVPLFLHRFRIIHDEGKQKR